MSHNVDVVRQSITIIAKVLSGKGIKVTQSGTGAYVESVDGIPKRINIPYIPDNASDDLILAINGFLDHEVAHVLFTDFTVSKKEHFINQSIFQIYNAIEDCRIEKCMRARFAGSRTNLDGVSRFFIEKYIEPEFLKCSDKQEMITVLFTPAMRAWSNQEIFQEYMKDKWINISQLQEKIASVIPKIALVNSTKEAVDLAHEIGKLLEKDKSSVTEDKDEGKGAKGESEKPTDEVAEESKDKKGESDEDTDEDEEDYSEDDEESKDKKGESDEDTDEDEEDYSEDDEESEDDSDQEMSEDEGEEDKEDENSEDNGESSESEPEPIGMTLDIESAIESATKDMSAALSEIIGQQVKESLASSGYSVYSTEYDRIERLDISETDPNNVKRVLAKIEASARKVTGPLQKTLERLVKSKSMVRNLSGKRSGRINAASLYRLKTGDDRVFRQRDIGISNDVAVSLVVDCSGSMAGNKIRIAMESAYVLCDVLTRLDISNEVIGFTTLYMDEDGDMREDHTSSGEEVSFGSYSRYEPLHLPIFKGFDEKFGIQQKQRMAVASCYMNGGLALRNNTDGESLLLAAKRLMRMSKEKTKQMIVLSDGRPCAYGNSYEIDNDLRVSIAKIERMGINIIGIGINDRSVKSYYRNNIVISNVEELPSLIIDELRSLII